MRVLPVLALAACAQASPLPSHAPAAIPVGLATVEPAILAPAVHGAGRLQAADEVVLSFPFGGVVDRIEVRAGDAVRRGQILAVLDADPARARLAQATSAHDKALRDSARVAALDATVPRQVVEDAATGLQIAEATLRAAEFEVRRSVLVAPADGVVLGRFAEPDQTVGAGMPVVRVATAGGFELVGTVPAADALRVAPGTAASVSLAAFPGRTFAGEVVERTGGAGGLGTFGVTVALADPDVELKSGLLGSFDLRPPGQVHRVVPLSAVAEADGAAAVVYAVEDGVARRVPVEIALVDGDRVALRGAEDLERVVAVGTAFVRDGAAVVVR